MKYTSKNRYDFMKESTGRDPITQSVYPDPLSLDYNSLKITQSPTVAQMQESDISMYLKKINDIYGHIDYDDIVLTLNGYAHRNFLKTGDVVYFPKRDDIENSFVKKGR